jgi:hypothetical protein
MSAYQSYVYSSSFTKQQSKTCMCTPCVEGWEVFDTLNELLEDLRSAGRADITHGEGLIGPALPPLDSDLTERLRVVAAFLRHDYISEIELMDSSPATCAAFALSNPDEPMLSVDVDVSVRFGVHFRYFWVHLYRLV